ncbi:MAG: hypothetical protein OXI53_08645 [Nitrospira sp.]|nr:hypothetical protein [Nitrospira sp.]MDE0405366.1 hypothetical protein [Nitrospira sp.]MDE0486488.1 hypothetical protein [Nitrospira sp.]
MKVCWWQGKIHLEPGVEKAEGKALELLMSNLQFTNLGHEIPSGPVGAIERNNQEPVVTV